MSILCQVRAMIQILKHFGWTWAGLLVSDDDYGRNVAQSLKSDLAESGGGCLAFSEVLPWDSDPSELRRIVHLMRTSTSRVVVVFAHEFHMIHLMKEVMSIIMICLHLLVENNHLMPFNAFRLQPRMHMRSPNSGLFNVNRCL